jgi:ubiquinone/menaquinone biosynthesis C-methylase UbiE
LIEKSPEVIVIIDFVKSLQPRNVLEVGANFGRELKHLEGFAKLYGIDISSEKISRAKAYIPDGIFRVADASKIPYANSRFEMVYSSGVFAHSSPEKIKSIMDEIYRVSSKYVLLVEYVGSHLSKNTVGNCKSNAWVHDYNKLVSGYDVIMKFNDKLFFGTDCFQVILMKKELRKTEKFIFIKEIPQERKFEIKIGKFKVGF